MRRTPCERGGVRTVFAYLCALSVCNHWRAIPTVTHPPIHTGTRTHTYTPPHHLVCVEKFTLPYLTLPPPWKKKSLRV